MTASEPHGWSGGVQWSVRQEPVGWLEPVVEPVVDTGTDEHFATMKPSLAS